MPMCLHSYLSSILGQLFRMCPRVPTALVLGLSGSEHNVQDGSTTLSHLARLSGVAKELVEALMAKLITPLGAA